MKKTILLFIFIFLNFLNPISLYFTLLANLIILIFSLPKFVKDRYSKYFLVISFFIFLWALAIMILQNTFNEYVFFKYLRTLLSTIFILLISYHLSGSTKKIIQVLSIIFFGHILSIGLQVLFPSLELPMAYFFQFDRETDVITSMGIRNLGLTSSYDTASLISVFSMIFFLIRFQFSQKTIYFLLSFLSLMSTMRTSRTGMLMGIILFIIINFYLYLNKKQKSLMFPILFFSAGIFFLYKVALPIIASTTVSFLTETRFNTLDNSNRDYTESTVTGLTSGSHLDAIREISSLDLIIGRGIDPNELPNMATDIGYIKIIYHVGLVGLVAILLLYIKLFRKSFLLLKNSLDIESKILSLFILWYIAIVFIFNYKSLELYSRGTHDLLLILFFLVIYTARKRHIITKVSYKLLSEKS